MTKPKPDGAVAISFSMPMIIALRGGWKTATRRDPASKVAKRAKPGTVLWVREPFRGGIGADADRPVAYRVDTPADDPLCGWRGAYTMPRRFSRYTLKVVGTRIEALHDMTNDDAFAEGVVATREGYYTIDRAPVPKGEDYTYYWSRAPITTFARFWDVLHGDGSWAKNPHVAVIEFEVVKP